MRPAALAFKTIVAALWLAAILAGAELFVRWQLRPPTQIVAHDENLGWRYLPNVYVPDPRGGALTTNSRGFRGPEREQRERQGKLRILVLGDSYTAGMQVNDDQLFTTQLEKKLNQDGGAKTEVINAGVAAWATDQELLYFESEGKHFSPSIVVLAVAPNDLRESFAKRFFVLTAEGKLKQETKAANLSWLDQLTLHLLNRSATVQWIGSKLGFLDTFSVLRRYYNFTFPVGAGYASDPDFFLKDEPEEVREARRLFEALVLRLASSCREIGAELVVTVLPTKQEFQWPFIASPAYESGLVSSRTKKFAAKNAIPFLDLLSAVRESKDYPLSLFIDSEYHFSERGHGFLAEKMAGFLTKRYSLFSSAGPG
jgi:lysophospholipase L1-like esterase